MTTSVYQMANQVHVIAPYWHDAVQTWVFDDDRAGLVREPFVNGVPEMIDLLVRDLPNALRGFRLLFSAAPFPGYQYRLSWTKEEMGGHWYRAEDLGMEGWLCPALLLYYHEPPRELYVKAEPMERSHQTGPRAAAV